MYITGNIRSAEDIRIEKFNAGGSQEIAERKVPQEKKSIKISVQKLNKKITRKKKIFKMAKNYEEFRKHGKQMVDYICDYVATMDQRDVAPSIDPGYLPPLLAGNVGV